MKFLKIPVRAGEPSADIPLRISGKKSGESPNNKSWINYSENRIRYFRRITGAIIEIMPED